VIMAFLLPFSGWQDVVSVVGDLYLLTYAAVAVSAAVFADPAAPRLARWIPPMRVLAPLSFIVATEFIYWSGWTHLRIALSLTLIGVPLFVLAWRRTHVQPLARELASGAWVVAYLVALLAVSFAGSFGGRDWLAAPVDSIVVAVIGLLVYLAALRSGREVVSAGDSLPS
jgi:hypothetical protein